MPIAEVLTEKDRIVIRERDNIVTILVAREDLAVTLTGKPRVVVEAALRGGRNQLTAENEAVISTDVLLTVLGIKAAAVFVAEAVVVDLIVTQWFT